MSRQHLPSSTQEQHRISHPLPGALHSSADPAAVLQLQATQHGRNRHESVAETLALVAILRQRQILTGGEVVTVEGAWFQHGEGDGPDQIQAAHCLPGQLVFDGRPLHTLPDWNPARLEHAGLKPLPLASKLRGLFGRTDPVDRTVNQVDSLIERMGGGRGLKPSFAHSAQLLLHFMVGRRMESPEDLRAVARIAFDHYLISETQACHVRSKELTPKLASTTDAGQKEKLRRKILVAETYLHLARHRIFTPPALTTQGISTICREVVRDD